MKHHSLQVANADQSASQRQDLLTKIATVAARFIAEDGATYSNAKQKAAQQVLCSGKINREFLPDNSLIEQQVRIHNQLFLADTQPARLLHLRKLALRIMQDLEQFNPNLVGAVLNGTAGEHSEIFIQLFNDNNKEVALYLLNRGIKFEVSEAQNEQRRHQSGQRESQEMLSFIRDDEAIHLVLFACNDLHRISAKKSPRANIGALQKLIEGTLPA